MSFPDTGAVDVGGDIVDAADIVDVVGLDRVDVEDVADAPDVEDAPDAGDVMDVVDAGDAMDVVEAPDVVDAGDAMDVVEAPDVVDAGDAVDVVDAADVRDVPAFDAVDVVDAPDVRDAPDVVDAPDAVDAPDVRDAPDVPVDSGGPITQNIRPGEACVDAPAMTATNGAWRYVATTMGMGDDLRATCASGMTGHADATWRLTLAAPRRVTLALNPTTAWSPVLSLLGGCGRRPEDPTSAVQEREASCVASTGNMPVQLSAVLPAGSWYVVVDGGGSGAFTLDVTIEDAPADGGADPQSSIAGACPPVPGNAARVALRDDEGSSAIPLGFNFPLYGQQYGRLAISSNGFVQMLRDGDSPAGLSVFANHVMPSTAAPNAVIAPYWDDLDTGDNGDRVRWWTSTSPRAINVRWVDVPRWRHTDQRVTVELRLEETGWIQFRYCAVTPSAAGSVSLGASATAGIESHDGRRGFLYGIWTPFVIPQRQLRFPPR